MLPFYRSNKRKYQCFCCGNHEFTDFNEFKKHIIENHEQGREYIKCPICDAPIRDLRSHAHVYHPNQEVKAAQMKSLIWYDFSGGTKKRKHKKPNFVEGYMLSVKLGEVVHYRSGLELEYINILEEDNNVLKYEIEPRSCVVSYFDEQKKKWRKYWPDFKVWYANGDIHVVEIKPINQTDLKENTNNKNKWEACNEACQNAGFTFQVITEKGLAKLKAKK